MRLSLLWLAGLPSLLAAQGFGVYEHSTCAMGRAGTSAAAPCNDGSAIFFNPAGLAGLPGGRASLGVTLIQASGAWVDDRTNTEVNLDNPSILVPNLYASYSPTPKLGVGVGLFVPYGLETRWPTDGFDGRFLGYNTKLRSIYVQPTVAYQVNQKVKLGIGFAYVHSDLELHQRVDLSQLAIPASLASLVPLPPGTTFGQVGIPFGTDVADAALEGSGSGYAVNFGAIVKINDRISIGGHWLTNTTIDYDGNAAFEQINTNLQLPIALGPLPAGTPLDMVLGSQFTPGQALSDGPVFTQVTMPSQGSLGISWKSNPKWTFMADYQYVVWGYFSTLPVNFERFPNDSAADFELYEGYSDTHGLRFGAEFSQSERETVRLGYLFHTGGAPDETVTPLLPEAARHEFTAGYETRIGKSMNLNLAYQYIRQNRRRGRVYPSQYGNTGIYEFSASLFGATLTYTF